MKKTTTLPANDSVTKKGYNEKNPGQPHGAFAPASSNQKPEKEKLKSTTADKKQKQDESKTL